MLTVHVTTSVGWLGAIVAYLALNVPILTSGDVQTVRAAYLMMEPVATYALIPLAAASLLTGILQVLGTPWGLFTAFGARDGPRRDALAPTWPVAPRLRDGAPMTAFPGSAAKHRATAADRAVKRGPRGPQQRLVRQLAVTGALIAVGSATCIAGWPDGVGTSPTATAEYASRRQPGPHRLRALLKRKPFRHSSNPARLAQAELESSLPRR